MSLLWLSLLGGVVALDGVTLGQFLVSRPLVAGLLAGWLVGDPAAGAAVGIVLEIYLLVSVPSGGARFPEPGPATVVGVAAAALAPGVVGLVAGVAAGLVWGHLGGVSQSALRRVVSRWVPVPGETPVTPERVTRAHLGALFLDGVRGCALTALGVAVARAALPALSAGWPLPPGPSRALILLGGLVSLGVLARGEAVQARRLGLFGAGLAVGLLVGAVLS